MRTAATVAMLVLLGAACSGGGDGTPTPFTETRNDAPHIRVATSLRPTPTLGTMLFKNYHQFIGSVLEPVPVCDPYAECVIRVLVEEITWSTTLDAGDEVLVVVDEPGSDKWCYHDVDLGPAGKRVEVAGETDEDRIYACGIDHYVNQYD